MTEHGLLRDSKETEELEVLLAQCYRVAVIRAKASKCPKGRKQINDGKTEIADEVNVDAKTTTKSLSKPLNTGP